jgi:hypothetical protein
MQQGATDGTLLDDISDWDAKFLEDIHGVIIVAANCKSVLERTLVKVKNLFHVGDDQAGIVEVTHLDGQTRPGKESGHEQQVTS